MKGGLQSPATYRRAEVEKFDEQVTAKEYARRSGYTPANPDQDIVMMGLERTEGLAIRNVILSFDAANAYGTPMRQRAVCQFKVSKGELLEDRDFLLNKAKIANGQRAIKQAIDAGAVPGMESDKFREASCCL